MDSKTLATSTTTNSDKIIKKANSARSIGRDQVLLRVLKQQLQNATGIFLIKLLRLRRNNRCKKFYSSNNVCHKASAKKYKWRKMALDKAKILFFRMKARS